MYSLVRTIIVLTLLAFSQATRSVADDGLCHIAAESITAASGIRGLKIKRSVPCLIEDRAQVRKYLLEAISTKLPPDKLKMEELVYKALGVIPESFDYQGGIVELYLSQLGGYYDPEKQYYVMAKWIPEIMQTTVAIHELTHALQDQHFNLKQFIDPNSANSDELQARSALVEGDATAVMSDYPRKLMGQPPLSQEKNVESLMLQSILSISVMAGAEKTPTSLQMMLVFPYTSGLRFVHQLLQRGGYGAVDQAFKNPPRSTEEILHPDRYLVRQENDYRDLTTDELLSDSGLSGKVIYSDTLGEFGISALLSNFLKDKSVVATAAAGWAGDRVGVIDTGVSRSVVWKVLWDSSADLKEFTEAFLESLKSRFGNQVGIGAKVIAKDGSSILLKKGARDLVFLLESPAGG